MRKVLIVLSLLVCSVSGATAQATLQSKTKVSPGLTDSIPGYKNGENVNFSISDLHNLSGARAEVLTNKTQSGFSNTFSNIPQSAVVNLVNDLAGKALVSHTHPGTDIVQTSNFRFASDAEKAIWNGKLSNITGLITGAGISAGSGASGNPYVIPGGLGDPGANGLVKRTSLNNSTPAIAGADYQAPLISGTSIRTVNGQSLLGSTDLVIAGGTGGGTWGSITGTLSTQTDLNTALGLKAPSTGISPAAITQNSTNRFVTDAQIITWNDDQVGTGGGASTIAYTSTAFAPTINLNFNGNNIDIPNVTGNFIVTGSNVSSGAERAIIFKKTTASPIVISIDQVTLNAPSMQSLTTLIEAALGAPPTFTVNAPINSVIRLYILIQGSAGNLIPDVQISTLGLDNAITVTANYNTLYVNHTMTSAPNNTSENIIAQFTIPANTMKAGSYLRISYIHSSGGFSGNAGNIQCKVRIGTTGITSTIVDDYSNTNAGALKREADVNCITLSSQTVQPGYAQNNFVLPQTVGINFAVDQTVYFTEKKDGSANDVAQMGFIKIEAGGLE